jgi:hypothetical protein
MTKEMKIKTTKKIKIKAMKNIKITTWKMQDDALPTPCKTQKWVQVQDNRRGRSRGTFLNSQHFEG